LAGNFLNQKNREKKPWPSKRKKVKQKKNKAKKIQKASSIPQSFFPKPPIPKNSISKPRKAYLSLKFIRMFRPRTKNFMELTARGFYDGLTFHRFEPGFVIQGGDPQGTGMGGSEKNIPLEITHYKHVKGALGMARSQDPNSASSQFYVCLADTPFLDGITRFSAKF
jgi:hypothetical protein